MSPEKEGDREGVFAKLLPVLQGLTLVAGMLIYSILSLAYDYFYSTIDLTPQDVGLGYLDIFTHSPGAAIVLAILIIFFVAIMLKQRRFRAGEDIAGLLIICIFAVGGYFFVRYVVVRNIEVIQQQAIYTSKVALAPLDDRRAQLLTGQQVKPIRIIGFTVLNIRATPVRLSRLNANESDPSIPAQPFAPGGDATGVPCVLYLGRTDDTLVVYNAALREVYRLPAARIQITSGGDLAEQCRM